MTRVLANGGDAENRRELDYYPTPPDATHSIMKFLVENNIIDRQTTVWECACGEGYMSEVIKQYVDKVYSTDIAFTNYGEGGIDFLTSSGDFDAVITNPPFKDSEAFIRHACKDHKVVAMLLKSQYWHAKKRVKLFEEFPPAYVLPLTWRPDFLFDQREKGAKAAPTMDAIWVVWIAGNKHTLYQPLVKDSK